MRAPVCGAEALRLGGREAARALKKVRKHQLGLARLTTSVIRYRSKDCDRAAAAAAISCQARLPVLAITAPPIGCRSVRSLWIRRCGATLDCGFSLQVDARPRTL